MLANNASDSVVLSDKKVLSSYLLALVQLEICVYFVSPNSTSVALDIDFPGDHDGFDPTDPLQGRLRDAQVPPPPGEVHAPKVPSSRDDAHVPKRRVGFRIAEEVEREVVATDAAQRGWRGRDSHVENH